MPEARLLGGGGKELRQSGSRGFADRTAGVAHQKSNQRAVVMIVDASEISVAALDAVDEPVFHEKFECTVDRDGRRAHLVFAGDQIADVIGTDRLVARGQGYKRSAAGAGRGPD